MPGFDGTGPEFTGPMTGGARGWCGEDRAGPGVGFGRGLGFGRGRRNWRQGRGGSAFSNAGDGRFGNRFQSASNSPGDNETLLRQAQQHAAMVQQRLDAINARIESLKANAPEKQ